MELEKTLAREYTMTDGKTLRLQVTIPSDMESNQLFMSAIERDFEVMKQVKMKEAGYLFKEDDHARS